MATDEPAIRVRGLRKRYPRAERAAVDRVDLDVRRGGVHALLGPNGAGKTTTVEILEGLRSADAGEVVVLGTDPARAGAGWRARIGVVLQSTTDLAELTPREALRHFAGYFPQPRDPDDVLTLVGLWDARHTRARQLSGGQRRRLDVGLGIVGRPELLFLDEPTTGFDPQARREFWELVRALAAEGTTILLTTHYLEEAEALADRLTVIAGGRVVADATPATLGGRQHRPAVVRWLAGGVVRQETTDRPAELVAALAAHGEPAGLTVTRPTLEDIYLELIAEPEAAGATAVPVGSAS